MPPHRLLGSSWQASVLQGVFLVRLLIQGLVWGLIVSQRNNRLRLAEPKLDKLKVMPWTKDKKASILKRGLYPAMLYGCEFHDMGGVFC